MRAMSLDRSCCFSRPAHRLALLALAGGLAGGLVASGAKAQDSVSTSSGLPGDAPSAYSTGEQVNNYVVDLSGKRSSWGKPYLVGPAIKSSAGAGFFNHLIAAQAVSNRFTSGAFLRGGYDAWRAPGQGVNAITNGAPVDDGSGRYGPRPTAGLSGQHFGAAFMEFAGGPNTVFGDGDDEQNIIVGVMGFEPGAPQRLYVSRIVAAVNKPSAAAGLTGTASLGLGGVDNGGVVHILADNFGMSSASSIPDKRLIRVAAASRGGGLNQLSSSGATDSAATRTVQSGSITQTTPTIIPGAVAGRPIMLGMDFAGNYLFEGAPNALSATSTQLTSLESPRGPISFTSPAFSRTNVSGTGLGVSAVLSRGLGSSRTRSISLWGVRSNGDVDGKLRVDLPVTVGQIIDPRDGFNPGVVWGSLANQEFTNYASQVSFRGANGPVALGVLPGGDLLVAATVAATGSASALPQSMDNYIAVARVSAATGVATWTIAAHTGDAGGAAGGLSKVILGDSGADGLPGTGDAGEGDGQVDRGPGAFIGRLARASEVTPGVVSGPSISSPAMDRYGNLYFLASAALRNGPPPGGGGGLRFTTVLVRANYDEASGGYELEQLAEVGDVIAGQNSTRNYQIQFMGAADGDSADSGAIWSGNIVQDLSAAADPARIGYGDQMSLGALVVRCKIVYDINGDGTFADPTVSGNTGSPDQGYNVAMVVLPEPPPAGNPADFNGDGIVDPDDLSDYIAAFFALPPDGRADFNGDGVIDPDDLSDYISAFFG